jgi:flagellar FliJ protein
MGFRFSLESVLRLRVSIERQEQTRLEFAARLMLTAQERCESLRKEKLQMEEDFRSKMLSGVTSENLHVHQSTRAGLDSIEVEAHKAVADARHSWEEQRLSFLQARRDREVVASIRERRHEEYVLDQNRREQQAVDDLFAMRRSQPNG